MLVAAKAVHVTAVRLGAIHHQYGAQKKTKALFGTYVEFKTVRNPKTNRTTTMIVADYELGGGTVRRKELNPMFFKTVPAQQQDVPPQQVPNIVATTPRGNT